MIRTLNELDDKVVNAIREGCVTSGDILQHVGLVQADFRKIDTALQRLRKRGRITFYMGRWKLSRAQDVLRMSMDLADIRLTNRQLWTLHLLLQRIPGAAGKNGQALLFDEAFATLDARELEALREVEMVVGAQVRALRRKHREE